MQLLTLCMLVVVTVAEFLTKGDYWGRWAILPKSAQYLPEILGALALVIVLSLGTRDRFRYVRPEYWLLFGGIALVVACGILVNNVQPGTTFAGLRTYLRALPWFFIPAVYAFSEQQVRSQLRLLLVIALVQLPLAAQQLVLTRSRFAGNYYTGDWISGTMLISSTLSIFLISAVCILTGLLLRKRITGRQFFVLFTLLLLPTTVNETKGTLLLLPLGLAVALLVGAQRQLRLKYALVTASLLAGFLAVFVPVYDHLISVRAHSPTISEFLSSPERLERYMRTGADIGATETAGRIDSIVVASKFIARDPVSLAFGVGIGNASESALGKGFTGRHFELLGPFLVTGYAHIVLELGTVGFALLLGVYWLIFSDARAVARQDAGLVGALAAGWAGITLIMLVTLFYKDLVIQTSPSFLFWYLSGLIAASRVRTASRPR
jgi:hypothetical protein